MQLVTCHVIAPNNQLVDPYCTFCEMLRCILYEQYLILVQCFSPILSGLLIFRRAKISLSSILCRRTMQTCQLVTLSTSHQCSAPRNVYSTSNENGHVLKLTRSLLTLPSLSLFPNVTLSNKRKIVDCTYTLSYKFCTVQNIHSLRSLLHQRSANK